jgi:hypothetical protein
MVLLKMLVRILKIDSNEIMAISDRKGKWFKLTGELIQFMINKN